MIQRAFLSELEHEAAGVRRTIERVPPADLDWRPHEKSMTFRGLVTHLVNVPRWGAMTLTTDRFDMAPGGEVITEEPLAGIPEALATLDDNVASFERALRDATEDDLTAVWTLERNGEPIFALPRIGVLRGMIMNHAIHHRAQLALYLRLRDVAVPSLYGPTADEA
ncbi:MAG: DinB family protein [Planctomycetota bacterium]